MKSFGIMARIQNEELSRLYTKLNRLISQESGLWESSDRLSKETKKILYDLRTQIILLGTEINKLRTGDENVSI